jgi:4-amino-4-deoxy-L-arabinose transferase-like glycosyltransferase
MTEDAPRRGWPWLVAAILLLIVGVGLMPLLDPDEGRFASASVRMIETGDPIVPEFNGEPRLNKPPLLYWLQAASFWLLGVSETAARAPSLLAGMATLLLVALWARRRLPPGSAATAAITLATTPLFFACARLGITDMLLTLWITATLILWHEAIGEPDPVARRPMAFAAAIACGLAVLTKGPVGMILPAVVIGLTATIARRHRMITIRGTGMALTGIMLVAGPWASALAGRIGLSEAIAILERESMDRLVSGIDHARPFYYMIASFCVTFLPWSVMAPMALVRGARRAVGGEDRERAVFLVVWFSAILLFFSIPAEKNDAYILPAAPPLALLVGMTLRHRSSLWIARIAALFLVVLAIFASNPIGERRSLAGAVRSAGLRERSDCVILSYKLERPSLVFYSGREVRWVRSSKELRRIVEAGRGSDLAVIADDRRMDREGLREELGAVGFAIVGTQPGFAVFFREAQPP